MTPRQAARLKILDPACGSGTFLLSAYQYLLDWHLKWYMENEPEKWMTGKNPTIYQATDGHRLTTLKKKEILLNNIFGVDINAQAVEVTKLSLLLKVLEGESNKTIGSQLALFQERVLPDLGRNIQCGNSLIGHDYFEGRMFVEQEERERVNAFDWQAAFPQVFGPHRPSPFGDTAATSPKSDEPQSDLGEAGRGFDAVIGNPPWISLSGKFGAEIYPSIQIEYLVRRFHGNTYMPNMYEYFVAQGLNLVKQGGYFSFIVPDRLGFNRQFIDLRKRILSESQIISLIYKMPFPGVTVDTLVFVCQKGKPNNSSLVEISEFKKTVIEQSQKDLLTRSGFVFGYFEDLSTMNLVDKIESSNIKPLKDYCESTSGYGGKSKLITESQISPKQILTLKGESIGRYELRKTFWFEFKKKNITGRTTDPNKLGATPKILLRKTGDKIIATYDESKVFPEQSLYFLFNKKDLTDYKYLLGVLNSRLLTAYYRARSLTNKKSIAQVKKVDLDELPIRSINFSDSAEKAMHDKMVSLVERMLALHKQSPRTPQEQEMVKREIESTDGMIDRLVYELYELSEEEVRIVEGN